MDCVCHTLTMLSHLCLQCLCADASLSLIKGPSNRHESGSMQFICLASCFQLSTAACELSWIIQEEIWEALEKCTHSQWILRSVCFWEQWFNAWTQSNYAAFMAILDIEGIEMKLPQWFDAMLVQLIQTIYSSYLLIHVELERFCIRYKTMWSRKRVVVNVMTLSSCL